jgi:DNA-directed RNA polymerase subunit F
MKILADNAGLISNEEVLQVLRDRGCSAAGIKLQARSLASEKIVYQSLSNSARPCAGALKDFVTAVQPFKLSHMEVLQLINLSPTTAVELHLIIDSCEDRLTEEQLEDLMKLVVAHFPKQK